MQIQGTTILAVKGEKGVALAGDGQVTLGQAVVMKHCARKIRHLYNNKILAGFAGSTADAFTLFERFETRLEEFNGNIVRASVEMAKAWRTDKYLRRLEAMLLVADAETILILSGNGDVIEPDDGIAGIGSGSAYAISAARALSRNTGFTPKEIVSKSMEIAAELCVYTNNNIIIETLGE